MDAVDGRTDGRTWVDWRWSPEEPEEMDTLLKYRHATD